MNVSVLAVGTELLLGQIVNANAATIGERLAGAGLDTYRQTVVGDNLERIATAVREALSRADAVVITGGIGPTQDDLTREALCAATGRAMVFDDGYADNYTCALPVLRSIDPARWSSRFVSESATEGPDHS